MTADALRALRRLDATTVVADESAFTNAYPANNLVTSHLWELLEDSETVLFEVPESTFETYCGADAPAGTTTNTLVTSLDGVRTRNGTTLFCISGAAAREVHDLLNRRDRLRQRLAEVEAGDRDEDADSLRQAADALDHRARVRDDLDSSFGTVRLAATAAEAVYYHGTEPRRSRRTNARLGV